ncbi:hydrolase [Geosmithia morbida]|uniref:Hydrolase n=1 Tax=Geosmithia morbida TaxID=1094350 RepID=A0A9P5D0Z7_9HYPO|nr:hydrolase [Geosmithia morbida]KAF4123288.1 hydrolase [Geosmithia morbida]
MKSFKSAIRQAAAKVKGQKKPVPALSTEQTATAVAAAQKKPIAKAATADGTIQVVLKNTKISAKLYAHITGTDSQGRLAILSDDGTTLNYPSGPGSSLPAGIEVGSAGSSRTVTIPRISGGRIWLSQGTPLQFSVNSGPALVEPSATNVSDPNYQVDWGFCEFTYNDAELYVNVSYVDFVSLPIALQLENEGGSVRRVEGMPADGLDRVAAGVEAQGTKDGNGWEKLVVRSDAGVLLRVLSPNAAAVLFPGLLVDYYAAYVDAVWSKYRGEDLTVNTQYDWGDIVGRVGSDGKLTFGGDSSLAFAKPSAADIFSCSTGPFAAGDGVSDERLNIGARIGAALNRSTLLLNARQPEGEKVEDYYKADVTNHFARVCHETAIESRGYAFPYDDVGPSQGADQSGFLNDPNPKVLTIEVGGSS